MVAFKKGDIKIQIVEAGKRKEAVTSALVGSNGLAISGLKGHYTITHVSSGLAFPTYATFDTQSEAKRFVEDVDKLEDWGPKFTPKKEHGPLIRSAYLRVMPERKTSAERQEEERARRVEAAKKEIFAARNREDFGHYDYKGGGYTRKGRLVQYEKLNKYEINALNRKGNRIAKAEATGSRAMHQARKRIYNDKRTWLKFSTYNRTRGKFLKG